jgi:hypothetical protein
VLSNAYSAMSVLATFSFYPVLRVRDVYPGSRILIFTHPGATKERGEKKIFCHIFFSTGSHIFHKTENYFIFETLKKKNLGQFSKKYRTFYPQICH